KLRNGILDAIGGAEVIDLENVGMRESSDGASFALEPGQSAAVIAGQLPGKHLDRDIASELGVPGPVNLSHPPRAERREDCVLTEAGAGGQRHEIVRILPSADGSGGLVE